MEWTTGERSPELLLQLALAVCRELGPCDGRWHDGQIVVEWSAGGRLIADIDRDDNIRVHWLELGPEIQRRSRELLAAFRRIALGEKIVITPGRGDRHDRGLYELWSRYGFVDDGPARMSI